jgi:hypothetical protein
MNSNSSYYKGKKVDKNTILKAAKGTRFFLEGLEEFRGSKLGGACAIGTAHLFQKLTDLGLKPKAVVVALFFPGDKYQFGEHCFIEIDGHVLDVTATQFQRHAKRYMNDIEFCSISKDLRKQYFFWANRKRRTFSTIEAFMQETKDWPEYQQPRTYLGGC